MTLTYYQKRAREIMREKHLQSLIATILACPVAEAQFYVKNEPAETEKQITEYLQEPINE